MSQRGLEALLRPKSIAVIGASVKPGRAGYFMMRNLLAEQQGWAQVGLWQGVTSISDAYLQFITATFSVWLLPTLARLDNSPKTPHSSCPYGQKCSFHCVLPIPGRRREASPSLDLLEPNCPPCSPIMVSEGRSDQSGQASSGSFGD